MKTNTRSVPMDILSVEDKENSIYISTSGQSMYVRIGENFAGFTFSEFRRHPPESSERKAEQGVSVDMKNLDNTLHKGCGMPYSRRDRKNRRGSGTPGREKTETCRADWRKRYFAKSARSYKDKDYTEWCSMINRQARKAG